MVAAVDPKQALSLDQFLAQPETKPAREYVAGIVTPKPMPKGKHSTLQFELASAINQRAKSQKIAYALPELRCTFADRSIVPDIAVLRWENLPRDQDGEISDRIERHPDWIIEILSPDQGSTLVMEKILFCLQQGTELGWLIDPQAKAVMVFQSGLPKVHLVDPEEPMEPEPLALLSGLDDWQLFASDIFNWLKV
ncbi:Uma2 family endonuclease [Spirulina major CS-329]|uniref:Uma2 family endonuclease n=1 Tax=Spirulina TaxID=1154 RepID=UPI00232F0870|nr:MULTISPECIES: Uma2 family endonuclease [Spirulina]MDB9495515.1 Uma2 family endonuclease [Spirulina subsalsa CS-330]MDB9505244.1 Uma2 family endonuclease [Spirulina major CS-329]